jgi:hypothetical protein
MSPMGEERLDLSRYLSPSLSSSFIFL